jgi:2-haloacid dehalogenase/putative hydrolase of the HAD superfamily
MKVVFDLGGVLLNWRPNQLLQQVWPDRAKDEATAMTWASQIFESFNPKSDWAQFDLGAIEPDDLAFKIAHRLGVRKSEMDALIASIPNHLSPLSGTVQILSDLKSAGHALFFLSNMPASYADYLESQHDFFDYFSEGIFSARVQQIKPNLEIFQMANEKFKVSGKDTFFIDDVQHNIDAAHAHGWTGIRFDSPAQVRQKLIDLQLLEA